MIKTASINMNNLFKYYFFIGLSSLLVSIPLTYLSLAFLVYAISSYFVEISGIFKPISTYFLLTSISLNIFSVSLFLSSLLFLFKNNEKILKVSLMTRIVFYIFLIISTIIILIGVYLNKFV